MKKAQLQNAASSRHIAKKMRCGCRTGIFAAPARDARRRTSTAIRARSAAAHIWRQSLSSRGAQNAAQRRFAGKASIIFSGSKCSVEQLKQLIDRGYTHKSVGNKLDEWFKTGLKDWDISRDGPYFGFKIPGEEDKYFYVWLDAPIGYMASAKNYCDKHGLDFERVWNSKEYELYHFIGKDIMYFHALFWPAMLMGAGFKTANKLNVHGFLTVNGEKMSKSRGTFIKAATYLKHLDPEYLRYYYASKLTAGIDDLDLNLDDFISKVNSDLVGKLANLASRSGPMLTGKLDGRLGKLDGRGQRACK